MPSLQVQLPADQLTAFCERWKVSRLAVFGSVLRADFRPDSDVDFLATFAPDSHWSLLDLAGMQCELEDLVGRRVDLVDHAALDHSRRERRRQAILSSAVPVYERA
jgi:predicted nucleotidyltransferase